MNKNRILLLWACVLSRNNDVTPIHRYTLVRSELNSMQAI